MNKSAFVTELALSSQEEATAPIRHVLPCARIAGLALSVEESLADLFHGSCLPSPRGVACSDTALTDVFDSGVLQQLLVATIWSSLDIQNVPRDAGSAHTVVVLMSPPALDN